MKDLDEWIIKINEEKLQSVHITGGKNGWYEIKAKDLRELLFRMSDDATIPINSHLLYRVMIELGIKIKGFKPNKTALREIYKLDMKEIN